MQTAALILAAGMSSRMGEFKPMLSIGEMSIAQRVVTTFRQAGVDKLVMVTGYRAAMLERHLAPLGLIFLRNEDYQHTQMFDSARIGLSYLRDKCDRVLLTPVDIPLFTAATVRALLATEAALACPVCEGATGHPTLLSAALIDTILADSGEGGLQGAFRRCGADMRLVPVGDRGVLHDADTPGDYQALLRYHNEQLVRPVLSVALAREKPFFDERTAMLLSLIAETRSVRSACQRMQMSYSAGWNSIRRLESQTGRLLVERSQGGAGGGRSDLSEAGRRLLLAYEGYAAALREQAERLYPEHFEEIFG